MLRSEPFAFICNSRTQADFRTEHVFAFPVMGNLFTGIPESPLAALSMAAWNATKCARIAIAID
jgi:hypothetical protein